MRCYFTPVLDRHVRQGRATRRSGLAGKPNPAPRSARTLAPRLYRMAIAKLPREAESLELEMMQIRPQLEVALAE